MLGGKASSEKVMGWRFDQMSCGPSTPGRGRCCSWKNRTLHLPDEKPTCLPQNKSKDCCLPPNPPGFLVSCKKASQRITFVSLRRTERVSTSIISFLSSYFNQPSWFLSTYPSFFPFHQYHEVFECHPCHRNDDGCLPSLRSLLSQVDDYYYYNNNINCWKSIFVSSLQYDIWNDATSKGWDES